MKRAVRVLALAFVALLGCGERNSSPHGSASTIDAGSTATAGAKHAARDAATVSADAANGGRDAAPDRGSDAGSDWPYINRNGPVHCGSVESCPDPGLKIKPEYVPPASFVPWPCCADEAQSSCGFDKGDGCVPTPALAPNCPAVTVPTMDPNAPCCTSEGTCGIDLSPLAKAQYACYDLKLVPSLGLVPDPPAPRRCDGTLLDLDAGGP
jgi:hypothetical protein